MKKILTLFFLALYSGVFAKSDGSSTKDTSQFIIINPYGSDMIPQKLKKGSSIKFLIRNVNTFKVRKDSIDIKSSSVEFDVPAIFSQLQDIDPKGTDLENILNNLKAELEVMKNESSTNLKLKANLNKQLKATEELISIISKEIKKNTNEKSLVKQFQDSLKKFNEAYVEIQKYTALKEKLWKQIGDDVFINKSVLKDNTLFDYKSVYDADSVNDFAKRNIYEKLIELSALHTSLEQTYSELNKSSISDSVLVKGVFKSDDGKISIQIDSGLVKYSQKKFFADEMNLVRSIISKILDTESRQKIIDVSHEGIDLYHKITEEEFDYYTDAVQLLDETTELKPVLKSSDGKILHEFNPLTINTKGGWKVNFSSGYFMNIRNTPIYRILKSEAGQDTGVVKSTNRNMLTHSLGGLLHAYSNFPRIGMGISTGAGLATNGNMSFHFGGSLFFTEKNRVVLTAGISFVKVDMLNSSNLKLQEDGSYLFISKADTEIKYDNIYKPAFFVSVTYNILKK